MAQKDNNSSPVKRTPRDLRRERSMSSIIDSVSSGIPITLAIKYASITYSTFTEWFENGRLDSEAGKESEFSAFYTAFVEADAAFIKKHLSTIERASDKSWQAAAWLAERTHREFSLKQSVELSGENGPLTVAIVFDDALEKKKAAASAEKSDTDSAEKAD